MIARFCGSLAFDPLGFNRKVDHHDRVFLHDSEQHDQAHERIKVQLFVEEHERKQRTENRRRQAGKNGNGMNEALVQNTEHDINYKDCHD